MPIRFLNAKASDTKRGKQILCGCPKPFLFFLTVSFHLVFSVNFVTFVSWNMHDIPKESLENIYALLVREKGTDVCSLNSVRLPECLSLITIQSACSTSYPTYQTWTSKKVGTFEHKNRKYQLIWKTKIYISMIYIVFIHPQSKSIS